MTKYKTHHPKSAVERLYIPRKYGGRGMIDINNLHNSCISKLRQYFFEQRENDTTYERLAEADNNYTPIKLCENDKELHLITLPERVRSWKSKQLHGRYPNMLENTDTNASNAYLKNGHLFPETEGFIHAIQDQVVATRNHRKYIFKENVEDRCRRCNQMGETVQHLLSACSAMAQTEYLQRHNLSCRIIHQKLALKYELIDENVPYYKYEPHPVLENTKCKLYWDREVRTDVTVQHNRPDLVMVIKNIDTAYFIDVTHPMDNNLTTAEQKKIEKYTRLKIEYQRLYNIKTVEIIPVVISANGLVSKNLNNHLSKLQLNTTKVIDAIQKNVILQSCAIMRNTLSNY